MTTIAPLIHGWGDAIDQEFIWKSKFGEK